MILLILTKLDFINKYKIEKPKNWFGITNQNILKKSKGYNTQITKVCESKNYIQYIHVCTIHVYVTILDLFYLCKTIF